MSEFEGYGKISESSSNWILDKSDNTTFKRTLWCVTEKIHGANFCFLCDNDGQRVRCGKRTSLLADTDEFFGYKRRLFNEIIPKIQQLYQFVKNTFPNLENLYVFGELFGGSYPHPDVPKIPNINAIQTGIWYCPDIEYCAFDLAIIINNKQTYLDYEFALTAFQHVNLFHAEPLFIGKYEEALDFKLGFNSYVPTKLGFPSLIEGNKAEGIVIKPMHEIMVKTTKGSMVRAIVKKKIEEFSEDKYNQAQKQELKNDGELSNMDLLRFEIDALITENRLNNTLSKIGHVTADNKEKLKELLNLYVKDVIDQLYENGNEDMWNNLSSIDRGILTDELTLSVKKIIIKYLKKNK
jgi:Rnl2 family RNA ligase